MLDLGVVLSGGIICESEYLDSSVRSVQCKDKTVWAIGLGMDAVELSWPLTILAELRQIVAVTIRNDNSVIVEPIRNEHAPVWKKRDVLWSSKMRFVTATDIFFT